jgi:hypothetical protein
MTVVAIACHFIRHIVSTINKSHVISVKAKWATHQSMKAKDVAEELGKTWTLPKEKQKLQI